MAEGGRAGEVLPFTKMQAVGNDFVVLKADEWPPNTDWAQQAIRLCDRRFGIGADGLMLWGRSDKAAARAWMWNPDGTEDMCGNGTRCVLHLASASNAIGASGTVETLSGLRAYAINADGTITVDMGSPKFKPEQIPTTQPASQGIIFNLPFGLNLLCDAVNTGSTHLICYSNPMTFAGHFWQGRGATIEDEPFTRDDWFHEVSALLETWRWFPERTSVMWTQVEPDNCLRLRIWERGVGETLGCGTGACAAAVAAARRGLAAPGRDVRVHSKGGVLRVRWAGGDSDPMYLTGDAQITYTGAVHGQD